MLLAIPILLPFPPLDGILLPFPFSISLLLFPSLYPSPPLQHILFPALSNKQVLRGRRETNELIQSRVQIMNTRRASKILRQWKLSNWVFLETFLFQRCVFRNSCWEQKYLGKRVEWKKKKKWTEKIKKELSGKTKAKVYRQQTQLLMDR